MRVRQIHMHQRAQRAVVTAGQGLPWLERLSQRAGQKSVLLSPDRMDHMAV